MFPFYGAVAMALLTVGSATGITGPDFLGHDVAITVSLTLWTLGTALGLVTYVVMMIRLVRDAGMATAMPFWLMPVVPPMVSATTGAAVSTHMPEGAPRHRGTGFLLHPVRSGADRRHRHSGSRRQAVRTQTVRPAST